MQKRQQRHVVSKEMSNVLGRLMLLWRRMHPSLVKHSILKSSVWDRSPYVLAAYGVGLSVAGSNVFMDQAPECVTHLVSGDRPRANVFLRGSQCLMETHVSDCFLITTHRIEIFEGRFRTWPMPIETGEEDDHLDPTLLSP